MLTEIVTMENLLHIYEDEVKKNIKNKRRVAKFEENKMMYLTAMLNELRNGTYNGGYYNLFVITKPKTRLIMSQKLYDKIINHFVARYILEPKLTKYLSNRNTATRKKMGTSYAIKLFKKDLEYHKKYSEFYYLKMDIAKYFYKIDHQVLKSLIKDKLSVDEYNLVCQIIDSTDKPYINKIIAKLNLNYNLPYYDEGKGLPIGNQTSQFLAIFYLSSLHHYIINNLHLKYLTIYMDDYIIIHHNKEYLTTSLKIIENILNNKYKLNLNKNKTYIKSSKEMISFLGYNFIIKNKKTIVKLNSNTKRKIIKSLKTNKYLFNNNKIEFKTLFCSVMNYRYSFIFVNDKILKNIFAKYWD